MNNLIEWMASPERIDYVTVWGVVIGLIGTLLALIGLTLTYFQAKNARLSSEEVRKEVDAFSLRRGRSDAISNLNEARLSIEVAGALIQAEFWREAASAYDEGRRALMKVKAISDDLSPPAKRQMGLIIEHLSAFSQQVDNASDGKGGFPDKATVRANIRRNSDAISNIQRELHEGLV